MSVVSVGIDLAKNVFAVHGSYATGKPVLVRPSVSRAKLLELIATWRHAPSARHGRAVCRGVSVHDVLKASAGGTASPLDSPLTR